MRVAVAASMQAVVSMRTMQPVAVVECARHATAACSLVLFHLPSVLMCVSYSCAVSSFRRRSALSLVLWGLGVPVRPVDAAVYDSRPGAAWQRL